MGLTSASMGIKSIDMGFTVRKINDGDRVIALAGNPNVGKSTVFNALTGLRQHTGNWPGKTVANAQGVTRHGGKNYILVDIPGTYSLLAHSREEEVAGDFICFGNPDAVVVVCDATCLERNMNLVLQATEITDNVVVCVNLMDEAKKKDIGIDFKALSDKLGVPVTGASAGSGRGLSQLMDSVEAVLKRDGGRAREVHYSRAVEEALETLVPAIEGQLGDFRIKPRWAALKLLDGDARTIENISSYIGFDLRENEEISRALSAALKILEDSGITNCIFKDEIVSCIVKQAEEICAGAVSYGNSEYNERDERIDRFLTSRLTGIPVMIALLGVVFWLTITGANLPSAALSSLFTWIAGLLVRACVSAGVPGVIYEALIFGVYRVLTWVVAVMLPPMAIFFPLFTLLEDLGYLPRVAFNLDKTFKKCGACGKQALTTCMGFGCNAAGIVGCRIIDSPRERLIAILTNNFVPCNGRFPTPRKRQQNYLSGLTKRKAYLGF